MEDTQTENIIVFLDSAISFIDSCVNNGGKILVHCHAGVSRSSSIVIAYIMYRTKATFDDSFSLVKKKHPPALPNTNF